MKIKVSQALINDKIEKGKIDYYMLPVKHIRDLVHGYISLTKFDLDLIDTVQFQRLKDIRQLTCQQVYPSARHTRFEHSLGVMELTRMAIDNLNHNKFLIDSSIRAGDIFDTQLQFNARIAALLHDVGHCPFSHLGEQEFDKEEIQQELCRLVFGRFIKERRFKVSRKVSRKKCMKRGLYFPCTSGAVSVARHLKKSELYKELIERVNRNQEIPGATHEMLSCIVLIKKFGRILSEIGDLQIQTKENTPLSVDFELLIRSIIGMPYKISASGPDKDSKAKNVVIGLINSRVFDMDKLDYVMRDSLFTGIGAPNVDTHRLFRNMFIKSEQDFKIVFRNRAVPSLQNMIEARDELYMYVYNHHTAVFSDFMHSYIFRRLAHNQRDLVNAAKDLIMLLKANPENAGMPFDLEGRELLRFIHEIMSGVTNNISAGAVPREYLFSLSAVLDYLRSDSDWISLLNILHYYLKRGVCRIEQKNLNQEANMLTKMLLGDINEYFMQVGWGTFAPLLDKTAEQEVQDIFRIPRENYKRIYRLIDRFQNRFFFKAWWKTNSEFTSFVNTHFPDDYVREHLCKWICEKNKENVPNTEFRSQLAKNVTYITQRLYNDPEIPNEWHSLLAPFEYEEFFVVQRSARFLNPDTISEIHIALKSNEILGLPDGATQTGDFYIKQFINVMPQRDYYSMYAKNSFYIFSKPLPDNGDEEILDVNLRSEHYHYVEKIFVFVATKLVADGSLKFRENYLNENGKWEHEAHNAMYDAFKNKFFSNFKKEEEKQ